MVRTLIASSALVSLVLGACASHPMAPEALVEARSVVNEASLDRDVLTHAPLELKRATDSLGRADLLLAKGEPEADVTSAAYVANRQARAALAVARAKSGDAAIAGAELEREKARGDMRTLEADRARASAGSARREAGQARDQAAQSDRRADSAEQRASGAEQRASGAEQRAVGAEQRASGAELEAAVALVNIGEAQKQSAQLQMRLNELEARQTERGLLVTLGDVLFEFNRAEIKPGAQDSLRKLADFLRQYPDRSILIEGHTDNVGSAGANEVLSRRRAQAVDGALLALGVSAQRMATAGYGEDYPVADNASDTNRALNRRVEVYIAENNQSPRTRR